MKSRYYMKSTLIAVFCMFTLAAESATARPDMPRKKNKKEAAAPAPSRYKQLTGKDSAQVANLMNVHQKGDTLYLEVPTRLMGKELLVTNKMQQVPRELNEAGVNKGITYENQTIVFDWDKKEKKLMVRQKRVTPEYPEGSKIGASVSDNYIDPLIATLKVETVAPDSSTVLVKVNELFNGRKRCLNDVFNQINIGSNVENELSRILWLRAFPSSVVAQSELTTVVHEGNSKVNITVVVSTSITPLPDQPMRRREENCRVGYFTTKRMAYSDQQQQVKTRRYITRWRLEPSDTAAYMRGELTEPVKPITFYIDQAVPAHLKPYIKQGIEDWNSAFEKAGFKNAIRALDFPDSLAAKGDDMAYSVLTYDASEKSNAMGPSVIDPRTGEILEADIIWWHNVVSLIREWLMVQTSAVDPRARQLQMPDELIGDAVRFVGCHEVGHSLGLRHNMIASNAYPTDSLRSASFVKRMGGTSASIMDYARFNYVAQPGDNVPVMSPHIGPYDLMAIEWGYRWWPEGTDEKAELQAFLARHKEPIYRYSETQPRRTAVDPRALSEDLGDNAVASARYGIANLKRTMPHIIDWTKTGEAGQDYDEAANFYSSIIYQWSLYLYHVMANVGGVYMEWPTLDNEEEEIYRHVEKQRQREALQFLLNEVLCYPEWLFNTPITRKVHPLRNTPIGTEEQEPQFLLKNQQSYILWDLLANERIMRMYDNELQNGKNAFTAIEMMDMLHRHIFAKTIAGGQPDVMERSLQKLFVDGLITAAAAREGVKINRSLASDPTPLNSNLLPLAPCPSLPTCDLSSGPRTYSITSSQVTRTSDAISLKRGELLRIRKLLKPLIGQGTTATQMHYDDIVMRINTALEQK